jgi:hypothetical protein
MSKVLGIVTYEIGDKVRFINKSDLPIETTKVDTTKELVVTGVELKILGDSDVLYQICIVSDGNAETFCTALELIPADEKLKEMWIQSKLALSKSLDNNKVVRKHTSHTALNMTNETLNTSISKLKNIKLNTKDDL